MLIAHASIPADHPETAARVLAEIMGGEVTPFPPGGPGSFLAWSRDGKTFLELIQRGRTLRYGTDEAEYAPSRDPQHRSTEVHLAVCVERSEADILEIAERAGWPTRSCDRGNGTFQLVEVWVDGAFLIEFLDPVQARGYQERVTLARWKEIMSSVGQPVA
jgi:hypothetical protein